MKENTTSCAYSIAWRGYCGKPATAPGRCADHAEVKCQCCGEPAAGECCQTFTQFVCGVPLCDKCEDNGRGQHRRKAEFDKPTWPDGPDGMPY